jgi:hypothetical protein
VKRSGRAGWILSISKVLRKPVKEYRGMFLHVTADMQMIQKGKKLQTDTIMSTNTLIWFWMRLKPSWKY